MAVGGNNKTEENGENGWKRHDELWNITQIRTELYTPQLDR